MKKSETKKQNESRNPSATAMFLETEPVANPGVGSAVLVIVFGILFFWGTTYMDRHAGNFSSGVYEPYINSDDLTNYRPVRIEDPGIALGRQKFLSCSPCHQPTGMGAPSLAPPLAGSEWVLDEGPNRIVRIVLDGLQGPITVKGVEWNLAMPPWKTELKDEEIAGIITYIRGNKDWGHSMPGVTKEEVAKIRKDTAARGEGWSSAALKSIPAK